MHEYSSSHNSLIMDFLKALLMSLYNTDYSRVEVIIESVREAII